MIGGGPGRICEVSPQLGEMQRAQQPKAASPKLAPSAPHPKVRPASPTNFKPPPVPNAQPTPKLALRQYPKQNGNPLVDGRTGILQAPKQKAPQGPPVKAKAATIVSPAPSLPPSPVSGPVSCPQGYDPKTAIENMNPTQLAYHIRMLQEYQSMHAQQSDQQPSDDGANAGSRQNPGTGGSELPASPITVDLTIEQTTPTKAVSGKAPPPVSPWHLDWVACGRPPMIMTVDGCLPRSMATLEQIV